MKIFILCVSCLTIYMCTKSTGPVTESVSGIIPKYIEVCYSNIVEAQAIIYKT